MTGVKLQNKVGRDVVGVCPSYFFDRHHLALGVLGPLGVVASNQPHVRFVERLVGDVAIVDGEGGVFYPSVGVVVKAHHHGAHALGVEVALGVFPSFLQQADAVAHVYAWHGLHLRETCLLDAVGLACELHLIIKHQRLGSCREAHARIEFGHGVGGRGDGFEHLSEVDASGSQHLDIDDTQHLARLDMGDELGAIAMSRVGVAVN